MFGNFKDMLKPNGLMHEPTTYIFTAHSTKSSYVLNKLVFFWRNKAALYSFSFTKWKSFFLIKQIELYPKKIYLFLFQKKYVIYWNWMLFSTWHIHFRLFDDNNNFYLANFVFFTLTYNDEKFLSFSRSNLFTIAL